MLPSWRTAQQAQERHTRAARDPVCACDEYVYVRCWHRLQHDGQTGRSRRDAAYARRAIQHRPGAKQCAAGVFVFRVCACVQYSCAGVDLFQEYTFAISFSYLEVYNEKIRDLLIDDSPCLRLRDNGARQVHVRLSWRIASYGELSYL